MSVRKLKPVTPAQRFRVVNGFDPITSQKPEKSLLLPKKRTGGRNNTGKMTVPHRGGGHKKRYRIIDFKLSLVEYEDGEKRYVIAQGGFKIGQKISSGENASPEIGNALPLSKIPLGTVISCIELNPGAGASLARSAGAFAQLMARDGNLATIKLPSGETRTISINCMASIGAVSNSDHQLIVSGKAGHARWLGRRPRTRPVAMNPVDHPMGGGEGRASGGHPRSRNGIPAKGYRTRSNTKFSNKFIIERRKK